jgi:hypothetical protein
MKQTAVEWFEEQVGHNSLMGLKEFNEIFEKAKEMEKDQIEDAYAYGYADGFDDVKYDDEPKGAEQYYNETFYKSINNKG